MDREKFRYVLNELLDKYKPKVKFDLDDYFDQVKFLLDSDIPRLKKKIIETCEFFPKPAELRKIGKEFQVFVEKKEKGDLDPDICMQPDCRKPVYDPRVDPFLCKEHFDRQQEYKASIKTNYKRVTLTRGNDKLLKTINSVMEKVEG